MYGTSNIRCVDLSVFPINFAAHPLSTIYAVAEKGKSNNVVLLCVVLTRVPAADIIKAEAK